MKYLIFLVALIALPVQALDVIQGDTGNLTCTPPTTYISGETIIDDPLAFRFYQDGVLVGTQDACALSVDTSGMAGEYVYTSTAVSSRFGNESIESNTFILNVLVSQTPNAPAQLNWE